MQSAASKLENAFEHLFQPHGSIRLLFPLGFSGARTFGAKNSRVSQTISCNPQNEMAVSEPENAILFLFQPLGFARLPLCVRDSAVYHFSQPKNTRVSHKVITNSQNGNAVSNPTNAVQFCFQNRGSAHMLSLSGFYRLLTAINLKRVHLPNQSLQLTGKSIAPIVARLFPASELGALASNGVGTLSIKKYIKNMFRYISIQLKTASIFTICFGSLFLFLIFIRFVGPGINVVSGNQLNPKIVENILDLDLLEDDEVIRYFYSDALVSIEKGFYILTNKKLLVYSDLYYKKPICIKFLDIKNIDVSRNDSFWIDTQVIVSNEKGEDLEFPLSSEKGGDARFLRSLQRSWMEAQAEKRKKEEEKLKVEKIASDKSLRDKALGKTKKNNKSKEVKVK